MEGGRGKERQTDRYVGTTRDIQRERERAWKRYLDIGQEER